MQTKKELEKYSSAITLSDMEIFIFPELMIALALANIMSPIIWQWRDDPWFQGMEKLSSYRKMLRVKQYIMDKYSFNLDLDTWGLTTKEKELARFSDFVDEETLSKSNALFGYEGDKYYFNIEIRKHFGLDKYTSNVIPYWKTETLEAMSSFYRKGGYGAGAGECVSFAVLYYAALFVLAEIPLEQMYMLATPLHSQNFVDVNDGVITNNRRLVTKKMWFNGTELSEKARRALQNERITFIGNNKGYVHTLYEEATLPRNEYEKFVKMLEEFLTVEASYENLASFLRQNSKWQKRFQVAFDRGDYKPLYIELEKVFSYEHGSNFKVGENTENKLLSEIDSDEYYINPLDNRLVLQDLKEMFDNQKLKLADAKSWCESLKNEFGTMNFDTKEICTDFANFCKIEPMLPDTNKVWKEALTIELKGLQTREEIIAYLTSLRGKNEIADLAFMAYRDLEKSPLEPFMKAAVERNPVAVEGSKELSINAIYGLLLSFDSSSIYSENRLAQPDEVWNFRTGDGLEKAICLFDIVVNRWGQEEWKLYQKDKLAIVSNSRESYSFAFAKNVEIAYSNM
ncbi:MAG: hypothetical protein WCI30_01400 [Clostridia bacterium]